ncbi:MAG: hypothetical protein GY769_04750 [bacterium]|nr:hypothetical protein [bacterium]
MKTRCLKLSIAFVCLAVGAGRLADAQQMRPASGVPSPRMLTRSHLAKMDSPALEPGAIVVAYEMSRGAGGPDVARKRLAGALGVLVGEDTAYESSTASAIERALQKEEAGSWIRLEDSAVLVRYDAEYDEIRLLNEELDQVQEAAEDVGLERAQKTAEMHLEHLAKVGAIDPRLYQRAALQVGYAMVGDGSVEKEVQPGRVVEYRFTFRPRLNGFEMANAGVRLGILASGRLGSLRFGGATPHGEWKGGELESTLEGAKKKISVRTNELMQRFYKSVPSGAEPQVAWSRVMYVMPAGKSRAAVEPMFIVSYSLQSEVEGQRVASRRKTVAYSLTDPGAAVVDFDAPARKHDGTEKDREYQE